MKVRNSVSDCVIRRLSDFWLSSSGDQRSNALFDFFIRGNADDAVDLHALLQHQQRRQPHDAVAFGHGWILIYVQCGDQH